MLVLRVHFILEGSPCIIGGGFGLMLACDLRLVTEDALLYFPEVDLGNFLPWGLTPMLARDLGMARAKELVLTCDALDPAEALSLGLINGVAKSKAALDDAADSLAYKIAAKPVEALQGAKMQFISMLPNTMQGDIGNFEGYMLMQSKFGPRSKARL